MKLEIDKNCIKCHSCFSICPEKSVIFNNQTYAIDEWSCTLCGFCIESCPTQSISLFQQDIELYLDK